MQQMSNRSRMLAFVRGQDHDRIPFVQYTNIGGPNDEIWRVIGRNNMGLLRWSNAHRLEHPNCRWEDEEYVENGLRHLRRTLFTPTGQITEIAHFEPAYGGKAWRKHFLESAQDYRVLISYLRDVAVCEDYARVWADWNELGDDGLPLVAVQRSPYQ
jgi:hypothetical protein